MSPVVDKIGQINFEGNITPHSWYQSPLLQNEKGKPNLVAITLLADIVYWYRPTVLRDETSGSEVGRRQKFSADKLQKNYEKWGALFGLTKRQVEDAMAFLKRNGLVTVETRAVVTAFGMLPNCAFIEPVFEVIREMTFPSPEKTGHRAAKKADVPKKRDIPNQSGACPEKTGDRSPKKGRDVPKKRDHTKTSSETPTETISKTTQESQESLSNKIVLPEEDEAKVVGAERRLDDRRNRGVYAGALLQAHDRDRDDAWEAALESTVRRMQKSGDPLTSKPAWFQKLFREYLALDRAALAERLAGERKRAESPAPSGCGNPGSGRKKHESGEEEQARAMPSALEEYTPPDSGHQQAAKTVDECLDQVLSNISPAELDTVLDMAHERLRDEKCPSRPTTSEERADRTTWHRWYRRSMIGMLKAILAERQAEIETNGSTSAGGHDARTTA